MRREKKHTTSGITTKSWEDKKAGKKWLAALLAAVVCVSSMATSAFASTNGDVSLQEEVSTSTADMFNESAQYQLGAANAKVFDGELSITGEPDSFPGITMESRDAQQLTVGASEANHPPVADLAFLVLNEESLKDGNPTVDTQIAWLYSYNGTNFTYDPDGDAITEMYVAGLPNGSIIGELPGMGFVTQFSAPGTYNLLYQVVDEHGAYSNVIAVEIQVVDYSVINNLNINYKYPEILKPTWQPDIYYAYYIDYAKSIQMAEEGYDPDTVWEECGSPYWFSDLPSMRLPSIVQITGTINNADGSPKANADVTIKLPLVKTATEEHKILETVKTNSNGEFSFKKDIYRQALPGYDPFDTVHGYMTGYCFASKNVNANTFFAPSVLEITSSGHAYRQAVTVEVGIVFQRVLLGNRWYWGVVEPDGYLVGWQDL